MRKLKMMVAVLVCLGAMGVHAGTTYTWSNGTVTGSWTNAVNWGGNGYPLYSNGDVANFSAGTAASPKAYYVTVPDGAGNKYIDLDSYAHLTLTGERNEGEGRPTMTSGAVRFSSRVGTWIIIDDLYYLYDNTGTSSGTDTTGANTRFELKNASRFDITGSYPLTFKGAGSRVRLSGKSSFLFKGSSTDISLGGIGTTFELDDSVWTNSNKGMCFNAGSSGSNTVFRFTGEAPQLYLQTLAFISTVGAGGSEWNFEPPLNGWKAPAITGPGSSVMFASGSYDRGTIHVDVPRTAGVWRTSSPIMVPLVTWTKGINTNVFDFAQLRTEGSYYSWLGNGTTITNLSVLIAAMDPVCDFKLTHSTADTISYDWSVNDTDYVGWTALLEYATSGDFSDAASVSLGDVPAFCEGLIGTITNLAVTTTYYVRLRLVKEGESEVVRVKSLATTSPAGAIASGVTVEYPAGVHPNFYATVLNWGEGETHVAKLYLGTAADALSLVTTLDVNSAGSFVISGPWPDYFRPIYGKIVYDNTADDHTYTSETDVFTYTPTYTATYTWKAGNGIEGDWTNAANWTISGCSAVNPTIGYPLRDSYHVAMFPANSTNLVRVYGGEACWYFAFTSSPTTLKIRGIGETPVAMGTGNIQFSSYLTFILDNVNLAGSASIGSTSSGTDKLKYGSTFRLQNHATFSLASGWPIIMSSYSANSFEVVGGSKYEPLESGTSYSILGMNGTSSACALLDDGMVVAKVPFSFSSQAGSNVTWTIKGESPLLDINSTIGITGSGGANLVFSPSKTGFASAPIYSRKNVMFAAGSYDKGTARVSIASDAPVWRSSEKLAVPLFRAPDGINTNVVVLLPPSQSNLTYRWSPANTDNPTELFADYIPLGMIFLIW